MIPDVSFQSFGDTSGMKLTVTVGDRVYQAVAAEVISPGGILLPSGNIKVVIHDQFSSDDKNRLGQPEVWPLYLSSYTDLTKDWQWFWFRTGLVHPFTGYETWDETKLTWNDLMRLKSEWASLTHQAKAFTNNFGTDNGKDYINNKNMNLQTPKQGDILACGNIVLATGSATNQGTPIETFDGTYGPPPIELFNRLLHPELFFSATNVAADKSLGANKWRPIYFWKEGIRYECVDPFPNVWGVPNSKGIDTIVPLRSNGRKARTLWGGSAQYSREYTLQNGSKVVVHFSRNYIDSHRLDDVEGIYVPSPYVRQ